jgi:4-hydroxy-tetrahydrodipicolinate synthase
MVSPPAVKLSAAQQADHFIAVANAGERSNVMLQDAPNELGVALEAAVLEPVLAAAPNVRYAKLEGHNTGQTVSDLLASKHGARLQFFAGSGGLHYLDLLDAGVSGVIPAFEAPGTFSRITRLHRAGEHKAAEALHRKLLPFLVFKGQSLPLSVLVVKELLATRGLIPSPKARIAPPLAEWSRRMALRRAEEAGLLVTDGGMLQ